MLKRFLIGLLICFSAATTASQESTTIDIVAKRFQFTPSEITVKKGQQVTLRLSSMDVAHGMLVEPLRIQAQFKKGSPATVTFVPQETGDFAGGCAHFCGAGHGKMHFVVHVRE